MAELKTRLALSFLLCCVAGCGGLEDGHDPLVNGPDAASLTTYWEGDNCTLQNSQGFCTVAPFSFALAEDGTLLWSVTLGTTGEFAFGRSTWTRIGSTSIVLNGLPFDGIPSLNLHDIIGSFAEGTFTAHHRNYNSEDAVSSFTVQTGPLPGYCGCVDTPPPNAVGVECVEAPDGYCMYTACDEGFFDCDDEPSNGCEADGASLFATDVTCEGGVFAYGGACLDGHLDCDEDRGNGCEVDEVDVCPEVTNAADVVFDCSGGCSFTTCMPGFHDCDAEPSNGCEVDAAGSCTSVVNVTGVEYDCRTSSCFYTGACAAGAFDCNGDPRDGCEYLGTACPVQLSTQQAAWIAVDGVNVYWSDDDSIPTDGGGRSIRSVPVGGGAVTELASGQYAVGLAVDATHVYWADVSGAGGVRRVPTGGGTVEVIAAYPGAAYFVALGASDVYFTTSDNLVHSVPKTGGAWTTIGPGQWGVSADAANVYVTSAEGAVWQHPIAGGPSIRLDRSNPGYGAIVVDDADVYWHGDMLYRVPIGGAPLGTPPTLVGAGSGITRYALASDETYIYWTDTDALWATPKAGGPDVPVASRDDRFAILAWSIAVDDTNVYWATLNGVWSAPKP